MSLFQWVHSRPSSLSISLLGIYTKNCFLLISVWKQNTDIFSNCWLFQVRYQSLQSALFKAWHHWEQHLLSISKRGLPPSTGMNCLFLHDVAKIQTTKLSILLRLYFHDVLEQLKNNFILIFASKGFLVLSMLKCLSIYITAQRAVMKVKKVAYTNFAI